MAIRVVNAIQERLTTALQAAEETIEGIPDRSHRTLP
jgi:hypothetical protein